MVLWKVQVKVSRGGERLGSTQISQAGTNHTDVLGIPMKTSFPLHAIVTYMAGSCAPQLWKTMLRG